MSNGSVKLERRDERHMFFEQDGKLDKASSTFFRGDTANFHPTDASLASGRAIHDYFLHGLVPLVPLFDPCTNIVAFGSCFASHISGYLKQIGYNIATRERRPSHLAMMGEGIVNTHAIRQQFEWAWCGMQPQVDLWFDHTKQLLGYEEKVRLDTRDMFDAADAFIITLGLSEIWYDEPTGEVFWRAVPPALFDPDRHKFRLATHGENLRNLRVVHDLIRQFRPQATIVFTLSPIPLKATFRDMPCVSADIVSKAVLRSALDELLTERAADDRLFYFPSFEVAQKVFQRPYMEDRRHVHKHVLDFNMALFERYYCQTNLDDDEIDRRFRVASELDRQVVAGGHWAVPRANLLFHAAPATP